MRAGDVAASPDGIEFGRGPGGDDLRKRALGLDQNKDMVFDATQHVEKRRKSRAIKRKAVIRQDITVGIC